MIPDDDLQTVEASPGARYLVAAIIVLLLLAFFYLKLESDRIESAQNASPEEIRQSIEAFRVLNVYLLVGALLQSTLVSAVSVWIASRSIKSGRFPPPGMPVLVRTRIVTGKKARFSAVIACLLAILVWIPTVFTLYLNWFPG